MITEEGFNKLLNDFKSDKPTKKSPRYFYLNGCSYKNDGESLYYCYCWIGEISDDTFWTKIADFKEAIEYIKNEFTKPKK